MPLTLKFSARAKRDIGEIFNYIRQRSPAGAKSVLAAIESSCLLLAASPQAARRTSKEGVRIRPLTRYPYLIFYRIDGEVLFIVHVRHSARMGPADGELE